MRTQRVSVLVYPLVYSKTIVDTFGKRMLRSQTVIHRDDDRVAFKCDAMCEGVLRIQTAHHEPSAVEDYDEGPERANVAIGRVHPNRHVSMIGWHGHIAASTTWRRIASPANQRPLHRISCECQVHFVETRRPLAGLDDCDKLRPHVIAHQACRLTRSSANGSVAVSVKALKSGAL